MRLHKILGILGATTAYLFIAISIAVSPWFNFHNNALSDLGNTALYGSTAWVFNAGLILSGLFEASFAISVSYRGASWKYLIWTIPLSFTSIDLALIGVFPENTGGIHLVVSVVFFTLTIVTMFIYSYASWPLGTPAIGAVALALGFLSATIWLVRWPWKGVAIQETLTSAMASLWLILVCLRNT